MDSGVHAWYLEGGVGVSIKVNMTSSQKCYTGRYGRNRYVSEETAQAALRYVEQRVVHGPCVVIGPCSECDKYHIIPERSIQ